MSWESEKCLEIKEKIFTGGVNMSSFLAVKFAPIWSSDIYVFM